MDSLLNPAFRLSDDLLKSKPMANPKNGEEYVRNVIFERMDCMATVAAEIDYNKIRNKQNVFVNEPPKKAEASETLLPSPEWQDCQEADFSEIRCHISQLYNSKDVWPCSVKLPSCQHAGSAPAWRDFFKSHSPVLSIVFTMRQPVLEYVLDVLIESLDEAQPGSGISQEIGKWLFAVLACLKLPLVPEVCSSLRELARKCSLLRSKLSIEDEDIMTTVTPLNLYICLVARYFRQGDLAD